MREIYKRNVINKIVAPKEVVGTDVGSHDSSDDRRVCGGAGGGFVLKSFSFEATDDAPPSDKVRAPTKRRPRPTLGGGGAAGSVADKDGLGGVGG